MECNNTRLAFPIHQVFPERIGGQASLPAKPPYSPLPNYYEHTSIKIMFTLAYGKNTPSI